MFDAFDKNDLLLSMMATVAGVGVDMEAAAKAFNATRGDFRAKFTAAVEARLASLAAPEVFIEVPEHPEELLKGDLEKLVRPAAVGFLRSYPTKDELLDQAARIRRRQDQRPAWIPRIDRDGNAIPVEEDSIDTVREPDRPLAVTVLAEVGEVTVRLPAAEQERAELAMAPGGIGEWESALYALYGFGDENSPTSTVTIDAAANEALVPDENRWWSTEPLQRVSAMKDPGVASELLATSATLGGRPVIDDTPEVDVAIADALLSAGDWRYSPQWRLETWAPGDDAATLAIARAAIAGWADDHRSGVIV